MGYADFLVQPVSLGLLYLLPITVVSLTGRPGYAFPLTMVCLVLREWLGPFDGGFALFVTRSLLTGTAYFFVCWLTINRAAQQLLLQQKTELQREELAHELELAAEMQRSLLPKAPPALHGFQLAAQMRPAKIVGGDYYNFFTARPGKLGVAIGDVSGKGVPAGMLMPALGTAVHMGLEGHPQPADLVSKVDRALYRTSYGRYATLVYAEIDATEKWLVYCNAGHPPPVLLRGTDGGAIWLSSGGPPVGLLPESSFQCETIKLDKDDVLVMYTDGVTETENDSDELFGAERLEELIRQNRHGSAENILEAMMSRLDDFRQSRSSLDDCTIVVLKAL